MKGFEQPNLAWNGSLTPLNKSDIEYIIVHHPAAENYSLMQTHEQHRDAEGWVGIGYNFYQRKSGTRYIARGQNQGAHAGNDYNGRSVGYCVEGNYDNEEMSQTTYDAAVEGVKELMKEFNVPASKVIGHRDCSGSTGNTTCPGNNFPWSQFKSDIGGSSGGSGGSGGSGAPTYDGQTFAQAHEDVWMQDGYEWLQEGLNEVMDAGLSVDGVFGQKLLNATRDFHDEYGLSYNGASYYGVPGPATKEKIEELQSSGGSSGGANLTVDGRWGAKTTEALQNALGTFADGVISSQPRNSVTNAIAGGIEFGSNGSPVVEALQRKVGAGVDGKLGPETVRQLQKYLDTPVDGVISNPSMMVEELQRQLNAGTF